MPIRVPPLIFEGGAATLKRKEFAERQAAFLVTLMLHAGSAWWIVLAFAGSGDGRCACRFRRIGRRLLFDRVTLLGWMGQNPTSSLNGVQ